MILEGDAKTLLDNFESSSEDLSHDGLILVEAYSVAFCFNSFKTHFIPRSCNIMANKLTKLAKDRNYQAWTIEALHCIRDILGLETCS